MRRSDYAQPGATETIAPLLTAPEFRSLIMKPYARYEAMYYGEKAATEYGLIEASSSASAF